MAPRTANNSFKEGGKCPLSPLPDRRVMMSAEARVKMKKFVDVLMEIFLGINNDASL